MDNKKTSIVLGAEALIRALQVTAAQMQWDINRHGD